MQDRTKGLLAISAAIVIWGFNFVGAKVTLQETNPFALIFLRHLLATAIFISIWKIRGNSIISDVRQHWRRVLPLAMLGIAGNQIFFIWGISLTTAAHSALMYTLLPICTAIFAIAFLKEKVAVLRWVGIGVAFAGAVLLATEHGLDLDNSLLQGDLITFVAVIVFSLFLVLAKPVLMDLGALRVLVVAYILAAPVVLAVSAQAFIRQDWMSLSLTAWGGAAFLIIFATVVGYLLHQFALKQLSAALLAAFAYGQPVTAAFFSVILLGEQLTTQFYVAFGLVCIGLFITERMKSSGKREGVRSVREI